MKTIVITQPDDWHVHFRDGSLLHHTVVATATHFARALVMPNIIPPLTQISSLERYRNRINQVIPANNSFEPYMSLYLNESVSADDLAQAASLNYVLGAKYYPAGATTNSEAGAKSFKNLYPLLDLMQQHDLVLQVHGEVTHGDIFDREPLFITQCLQEVVANFPKLRIVLEHISTKFAVDYLIQAPATVAATITPHHLLYNRNQLLVGGIKPHYYCLPILKRECDQVALQHAVASGNPKFFAGTDSAPHELQRKESDCGCAGIYSAPYALALYAQLFSNLEALDKLNDFTSRFGAEFYGLSLNKRQIQLIQHPQTIPKFLPFGSSKVIPIAANELISWSINDQIF